MNSFDAEYIAGNMTFGVLELGKMCDVYILDSIRINEYQGLKQTAWLYLKLSLCVFLTSIATIPKDEEKLNPTLTSFRKLLDHYNITKYQKLKSNSDNEPLNHYGFPALHGVFIVLGSLPFFRHQTC